MHSLLAQPTREQALLLDVVYAGRKVAGCPNFKRAGSQGMQRVGQLSRWPTFLYVESVLAREHGIDARSLLADFPAVSVGGGIGSYGWVWSARASLPMLQPGDELALTVAGMAHVPDAAAEVEAFLDALAFLIEHERSFLPLPTDTEQPSLRAGEMQSGLAGWDLDQAAVASIGDLMTREPGTWHCQTTGGPLWEMTLSPFLRGYAGLTTAGEYVQRVVEVMAPPTPTPEPLYPSALSLPEAVDYLNAVWRLHAGRPLLRIARAEAAAKLALDCASADEFDARLSALCGILDGLQLPDGDGCKLIDLREYLARVLPEESVGRAQGAVDDLRAFFALRVWRQHPGADHRATEAIQRLGLALPITEWGAAWQHLQGAAVAALSALREEIEQRDPS